MNTKQLEYFIAVAEELNFTKAANKCYISQTAVTLQIKSLEESLGIKLFERTNRHVKLTNAGSTFYVEATTILNHIKDAVEKTRLAANGTIGSISIGFVADYEQTKFINLIQSFHHQFPNIDLKFHTQTSVSELYKLLLHHDIDILFNINFDLQPNEFFNYSHVEFSHLYAVLYPAHPLAYRNTIKRCELKNDLIILLNNQTAEHDGFSNILKSYMDSGFVPNVTHHTTDLKTLFVMVAAEMGIALLPEYVIQTLNRTNTLVTIPLEGEKEQIEIVASWNKNTTNTCTSIFLEFMNQ